MSLAIREYFWNPWPSPTPPTGQSPRASRYRGGYRANYVTGAVLLLVVLLWN